MGSSITSFTRFGLIAVLFATAGAGIAQGPPGHDPNNQPPGHGGAPPGQAKKQGGGNVPPGQAKKQGGDFRFQNGDRERFYPHYSSDANHWNGRKRPAFERGQTIPRDYVVRPVPQSYWAGGQPPPPGYQYGYYDGYVVAYNPTTRIIADVLDLVGAAASR